MFGHSALMSPGLPMSPGWDQQSAMGMNSSLSNPALLGAAPSPSGTLKRLPARRDGESVRPLPLRDTLLGDRFGVPLGCP